MSNYSMELDGVTFPLEGYAPFSFKLLQFNPWEPPDWRTGDVPRGMAYGVDAGRDRLGSKKLTIRVLVEGADAEGMLEGIHLVNRMFGPRDSDVELTYTLADRTHTLFGRPRGASVNDTRIVGRHKVIMDCRFLATDPRAFLNPEEISLAVTASDIGMEFPVSFPLYFGVASNQSYQTISLLRSNTFSPWEASVFGPVLNPQVYFLQGGEVRKMQFGHGGVGTGTELLLEAFDDRIYIDSKTRTAVRSNGENVRRYLTSDSSWMDLNYGYTTVRFGGDAGYSGGHFIGQYREALI